MDELISKKELLEQTNISYGQLYRWKRKRIIPEEWFIKKSAPTGQETYFPKDKILERIDVIVNMKDEASLDELARVFSAKADSVDVNLEQLIKKQVITEESITIYKQAMGHIRIQEMKDIVGVKLFKDYVISGEITIQEGVQVISFLRAQYENLLDENAAIYLIRHLGMPLVMGSKNKEKVLFGEGYKIVKCFQIAEEISTIKYEVMY